MSVYMYAIIIYTFNHKKDNEPDFCGSTYCLENNNEI